MSELVWIEGAGNRFALFDALRYGELLHPAPLARELALDERRPDGLLLLDRDGEGRLRMTIFNRDGSRPAACGNGLRCIASYAVDAGHAARGEEFELATDAGLRQGLVTRDDSARVSMGRARVIGEHDLELDGVTLRGIEVDMGNPHLVLERERLSDEEVGDWGPRLERDPRFAQGTNVEFVVREPGGLRVRVWERGVGETAACGTGACAVAAALAPSLPVTVRLPGGALEISEQAGELWLEGPVRVVR